MIIIKMIIICTLTNSVILLHVAKMNMKSMGSKKSQNNFSVQSCKAAKCMPQCSMTNTDTIHVFHKALGT